MRRNRYSVDIDAFIDIRTRSPCQPLRPVIFLRCFRSTPVGLPLAVYSRTSPLYHRTIFPEPVENPPYAPVGGGVTYAQESDITYGKIFCADA